MAPGPGDGLGEGWDEVLQRNIFMEQIKMDNLVSDNVCGEKKTGHRKDLSHRAPTLSPGAWPPCAPLPATGPAHRQGIQGPGLGRKPPFTKLRVLPGRCNFPPESNLSVRRRPSVAAHLPRETGCGTRQGTGGVHIAQKPRLGTARGKGQTPREACSVPQQ